MALSLFAGEPQFESFPHMDRFYATRAMAASTSPENFPAGPPASLPERYGYRGDDRQTAAFLDETDTAAILVLKDGLVRLEEYFHTGGADVRWISWSVAKSFVSALIGIAIDEGSIRDVDDPITDYVPVLRGSAYDGVRIRHVLQMSSGARWSEDYSDPDAEVHGVAGAMAGQTSLAEFVSTIRRATEPGTLCQYNSADTQALGMMLVAATGRSLADYMEEKLCGPLGMSPSGYWILDSAGMEMALGGLNLTARDFARIGELYRNHGRWHGRQVVPEGWARDSVACTAPHLRPGKVIVGGHVFPFGYGYQWWVPAGDRGEFSAIGIYNQFVYVDPSRATVIVKLSANRAYGTSPGEATNREEETLELLRAIARAVD